jgi:hypothetical protein
MKHPRFDHDREIDGAPSGKKENGASSDPGTQRGARCVEVRRELAAAGGGASDAASDAEATAASSTNGFSASDITDHLASCSACRRYAADVEALAEAARVLGARAAAAVAVDRTKALRMAQRAQRIKLPIPKRWFAGWPRWALPALSASLSTAAVILVLGFNLHRPGSAASLVDSRQGPRAVAPSPAADRQGRRKSTNGGRAQPARSAAGRGAAGANGGAAIERTYGTPTPLHKLSGLLVAARDPNRPNRRTPSSETGTCYSLPAELAKLRRMVFGVETSDVRD